jgi:hypothetical protein
MAFTSSEPELGHASPEIGRFLRGAGSWFVKNQKSYFKKLCYKRRAMGRYY